MIIKFKLKQNDFFQLSLFHFKEENSLKKIIFIHMIFWGILYSVISFFLYINDKLIFSVAFAVIAVITMIRIPFLVKRYFNKTLLEQTKVYKDKFNEELTLEINDNYIKTNTTESETITKISQIEKIIETKDHYFIKFKPDFIFIPKSEIENQDVIKTELQKLAEKLNIEFQNKLDWKW